MSIEKNIENRALEITGASGNGPRVAKDDFGEYLATPAPVHYTDSSSNVVLGRLINLIDHWGQNRQLDREHGCTALSQIKKLKEEINELEKALLEDNELEIVDGIGDALTVLIQIMRLTQIPMIEALERAYSQIRYRKGKMIDGIFVKNAE